MYSRLVYRIPFSETDAMGIVHHSNHARYFERGRIEMLRQLDQPYVRLTELGLHFAVIGLRTAFRKPMHFDSLIAIETRITSVTKTRLQFSYRIFPASERDKTELLAEPMTGAVFADAVTDHCCVNQAGRPQPMPAETYANLTKALMEQEPQ